MLEELKEEEIVNRQGGRFKLSTLIQKRLVALRTGARPLVPVNTDDKMAVVIHEILREAISLDTSGSNHHDDMYSEETALGIDPHEMPAAEE